MNSSSRWTPSLLFPLALLASLAAACRTAPTRQALPAPVTVARGPLEVESVRTPAWVGEPLSWEKLAGIEAWIATHEDGGDPYWRVEGELQLNQGRLEFARRESPQVPKGSQGPQGPQGIGKKASAATVRSRIQMARAGFGRIAGEEGVTPSQKKRAQDGIARADRMLGTAPAIVAVVPALVARTQWGAMPAHAAHMEKNRAGWRRITVHHSAEREPLHLDGTLGDSAAAVRSIQKAHMDGKETGYGDIGYHFVIDPSGRTFQGRDLAWQGAHAAGDNNVQNLGVCVLGNFSVERPTKPALEALEKLLDHLRTLHKIPRSSVFTHDELKSTDCPGKHLARWVESYRRS